MTGLRRSVVMDDFNCQRGTSPATAADRYGKAGVELNMALGRRVIAFAHDKPNAAGQGHAKKGALMASANWSG